MLINQMANKMKLVFALLIAVQAAGFAGCTVSLLKSKGTDLKALCAGKEIDLTAWFELEQLVAKLSKFDAPVVL
jgi:hypothetical protein